MSTAVLRQFCAHGADERTPHGQALLGRRPHRVGAVSLAQLPFTSVEPPDREHARHVEILTSQLDHVRQQ